MSNNFSTNAVLAFDNWQQASIEIIHNSTKFYMEKLFFPHISSMISLLSSR
jgi:hypothetical protein